MINTVLLASALTVGSCGRLNTFESGGDFAAVTDRDKLATVEAFHFTRAVESLSQGLSGTLGADISYTLERFPNHYRALAAIARLGLRDKTVQPRGAKYTVTCFFDRAIRFRDSDPTVRTLYGGYLLAQGLSEQALEQFTEVARLDPANATAQYNLGLLYLKKKDYPLAREHAHAAYALGFPLPALRERLRAANEWE